MSLSRSSSTHTAEGRTSRGSDVSAPLSPTTTMTSTHTDDGADAAAQHTNDYLDDIFGSSPPDTATATASSEVHAAQRATAAAEPSDLPSVRRQHVTAGYRDGISVSKGANVQRGFDTAFPVGGNLGLRAGILLGILEGIVSAVGKGDKNAGLETLQTEAVEMFREAKKELTVNGVFGGLDQSGNDDKDPVEQLGGEGERVLEAWETRVRTLVAGQQS